MSRSVYFDLKDKILKREANVGVIGIGYVGLPLSITIANNGFKVIAIDINEEKIQSLKAGKSYVEDVSNEELQNVLKKELFFPSSDYSNLKYCDVIIICVPTPLRKTKDPDISYIISATKNVAKILREGQLIILESTTYPGTTIELLLPILKSKGLKVGEDFFLAFSPERVDPGNKIYNINNTPKVVGGVTKKCGEITYQFYKSFVKEVIKVSDPTTAEMVKLLENTFRAVNIALVNEFAIICNRLKINVWEVIEAASSKPFGFMTFYPGPGLGGHCLPVDPHYLAWKLKSVNYRARFIELADSINTFMPYFVLTKISDALNDHSKCLKNSKILIIGVTYKRDVGDIRESPALDIINLLFEKQSIVYFNDPYVEKLEQFKPVLIRQELTEEFLKQMDATVIITDHSSYDYEFIVKNSKVVIDTRNITKPLQSKFKNIITI